MKKFTVFLTIILLIVLAGTLSAQNLTVTSVTPRDGSTGVDTSLTITVEFNNNLSEKLWSIGTDIEEIFLIMPKPLKVFDLKISGKKLSINVQLSKNQSYQIALSGKILWDKDGNNLGKTITILGTITTGSSLPAGSISGKLTPLWPLTKHQSAVAISTPEHNFDPPDRIAIVKDDSTFIITNVEPGSYSLMGAQFTSLGLERSISSYYPTAVPVSAGQTVTNINFTISPLKIVSSTPQNLAVNVDTNTTLSLTFSEALATYEGYEDDFVLSVEITPRPLQEGKLTISADKKTISLPVVLAKNKVYKTTVYYAKSEQGNFLVEPVTFIFSTGASLPTGSISGTINVPQEIKGRTIFVGLLNESGIMLNLTKVDENGIYQISSAENGSYYVIASTVDLGEEEYDSYDEIVYGISAIAVPVLEKKTYVAYYGWNGTAEDTPDLVTVANGGSVTGINMTLTSKTVMKLLSHSPKNGDLNVPAQNATLTFTFNLPLQMPSNNENPMDFLSDVISLNVAPSSARNDTPKVVFSNHGRTVTLTGNLTSNMYYTVLLLNAKDLLGSELLSNDLTFANPTAFGFTTGSTLPATSISGKVSLQNKDVDYVAVGMLRDLNFMKYENRENPISIKGELSKRAKSLFNTFISKEDPGKGSDNGKNGKDEDKSNGQIASNEPDFQALGLANLETGTYSIFVQNGTYWPVAQTSIPAGKRSIEKFGFYDPDSNGHPDSVIVKDNSLTGVNISFIVPKIINVTGIIRDARQMPVRNATIVIYNDQWSDQTTSNQGGVYQLINIPAGKYTVYISPPQGTNLQYKKLELEIGEKPVMLNITLGSIEPHYKVNATSASYPIIVTNVDFEGLSLESGDEIAVRGPNQRVVGSVTFTGSFPDTIIAWADNPATTNIKEGFAVGDTILFEIYKTHLDKEISAYATYTAGNGKFGTGTHSIVSLSIRRQKFGEKVERLISNINESVREVFENNSTIEVKFETGKISDVKVEMKSFGTAIPETIRVKEKIKEQIQKVAAFFQVETTVKDTFSAKISFGYSESILTLSGIDENDLVIAYYDTILSKWKKLPTEVDVVKKIATANTKHFSLWSLADNNDNVITDIEETPEIEEIPQEYFLFQNYPNPFNPMTAIRYQIKKLTPVNLTIYNLLGQKIRELINREIPAGTYEIIWDGKSDIGVPVSSGIYFYRLKAGNFIQTKKMVLIR